MKNLPLLGALALTMLLPLRGQTQDVQSAGPETRAEVKADARAAERAQTIPRGDASLNMNKDTSRSTASRPAVKAATRHAERTGEIPVGEASLNADRDTSPSNASRSAIKQETKEAVRHNEIPRGEADVR